MARSEIYLDPLKVVITEFSIALEQNLDGDPNFIAINSAIWPALNAAVMEALPHLATQPAAPTFPLTSASPRHFALDVEVQEDGNVLLTQEDAGGKAGILLHPSQLCTVIDYVRRVLQERSADQEDADAA